MARTHIAGTELTTGLVTKHTVPSGVQVTLIEISFLNTDTSNRGITVHFVPSGGTASDANRVIHMPADADNSLRSYEKRIYVLTPFLSVGDFVQASATTASVVQLEMSILEEAT